jgi:hypothetical protein
VLAKHLVGLSGKSVMYANRIDTARKIVAVLFGVSGVGFALCVNLRYELGAAILGALALGCLLATLGLIIEYLVRSWVETRKSQMAVYQFSLSGMMALTAGVAVLLAIYRVLGPGSIALFVVAIVIGASGLELHRRKRADANQQKSAGDQHEHRR